MTAIEKVIEVTNTGVVNYKSWWETTYIIANWLHIGLV